MIQHLIYDIGANTGENIAKYLTAGYAVLAVEANSKLYSFCRERFASEIEAGRLIILNVAIAPENGPVAFWVNRAKDGWSSILKRMGTRGDGGDEITVQGRRFEEILEEYGVPYYLKVDIEGSDYLCLEALSKFAARPQYISVEAAEADWLQMLYDLDYRRFALIDQAPFNANGNNLDRPDIAGPLPEAIGAWADIKTVRLLLSTGESWYDIYATW